LRAHGGNFLGDDLSVWKTVEGVPAEGWEFVVVHSVVLVQFLKVVVVTVVSRESVETVDSWEGVLSITTVVGWDGVVDNITTVDVVVGINGLFVDVTEDGDKVDLVTDHSLINFWGDDMLLEEDLDKKDILVGDGGEVEILSVDLTEDGVELGVSTDDGFVDLWGDDVLLKEDLEEEDITLGDGVELSILSVDLTDDVVEIDLATDDGFISFWGDDILVEENLDEESITGGDVGEVDVLSVDLTENGEEVNVSADDGLEDLWGDNVLLQEDVQEEDIINVLLLVDGIEGFNWEDFLDWDDGLGNLDVDDLGFFDNLAFSGDGLNNKLLLSDQSLNISLDLGHISDGWLVSEQVLVDLVQEELVVGGSGGVWQVLTSEAGGGKTITVVVNVGKGIPVLVVDIIVEESLVTEDILRVDIIVSVIVVGGEVVFGVEELDKGLDVLVEVDRVQEVLLEGRDLPELLEVDGRNITLEGWVLDVLTEEGESQVLTEELRLVELLEGEDLVNSLVVVDSLESFQVGFVLNWVDLVDNGSLEWELVDQLLLQQIIDDWPLGVTRNGSHQKSGNNESFHVDCLSFEKL